MDDLEMQTIQDSEGNDVRVYSDVGMFDAELGAHGHETTEDRATRESRTIQPRQEKTASSRVLDIGRAGVEKVVLVLRGILKN